MSEENPRLVAITGFAHSEGHFHGVKGVGKSAAAQHLVRQGYVEINLADKLKDMICRYFRLNRQEHDTPEGKNVPIKRVNYHSFRTLCERVATEVVRENLGAELGWDTSDVWVQAWQREYRKACMSSIETFTRELFDCNDWECFEAKGIARYQNKSFRELCAAVKQSLKNAYLPVSGVAERPPSVLVGDVRYPNEYHALRRMGAKVLQVRRHQPDNPNPSIHSSNQFYPEMTPDHVIDNDDNSEAFHRAIDDWVWARRDEEGERQRRQQG